MWLNLAALSVIFSLAALASLEFPELQNLWPQPAPGLRIHENDNLGSSPWFQLPLTLCYS